MFANKISMKTISIFLIVQLCCSAQLAWGQEPEWTQASGIQELKNDIDEDYAHVFSYADVQIKENFARAKKTYNPSPQLRKTLLIYDNNDLKGEPIYTITSQEIKSKDGVYRFISSFIGECTFGCEKYNFIPINFIRIHGLYVSIAIIDYKDGVARVEHNRKNYYFKLNLEDIQNYTWRYYKNSETIKNYLERDSSFKLFVSEIKKCISKKDLECLNPFLSDNATIEAIQKSAKERAVLDDVNLCNKIRNIANISPELLAEVKNIDFLWDKLSYSLDLTIKDQFKSLTIEEFGKKLRYKVSKVFDRPMSCQKEDFDVELLVIKNRNEWKIWTFELFNFTA